MNSSPAPANLHPRPYSDTQEDTGVIVKEGNDAQDPQVPIDDQEFEDLSLIFGIFDSLTLTKERLPSMNLDDEDFEDDMMNEEEVMMPFTKESDDKVDFESSLDDVTKIGNLMTLQEQARRRTGVRRGYQDTKESNKIFAVPTKFHDGPTPYASRAMFYKPVSDADGEGVPTKPMRSPAA